MLPSYIMPDGTLVAEAAFQPDGWAYMLRQHSNSVAIYGTDRKPVKWVYSMRAAQRWVAEQASDTLPECSG